MMGGPTFSEHYIPYLLNRADHVLSARLHQDLNRRGIQTSDWRVLAILLDQGRCTVGELTSHVRLPQPTITHTIARLEKRQHVSRSLGTQDRRKRFVELTAEGASLATELVAIAESYENEALNRFDDADDLRAALHRLITGLEASAE